MRTERHPVHRILKVCAGALAALAIAPTAAMAADRVVNDNTSGPGPIGADCTVAAPFTTIQAAIDAATAGDRILVCAGSYNESVSVNKTLQVLGAQSGVDARSRSVPATDESVITGVGANGGGVSITANDVVFDGFVVEDTDQAPFGSGIVTGSATSGNQVINNISRSNISGATPGASGTTQTVLRHNLFDSNNDAGAASGSGIYVDTGVNNLLIDQNRFTGHLTAAMNINGSVVPASNVSITANALVNDSSIVLFGNSTTNVTGNTSSNIAGSGIFVGGGNAGIAIAGNRLDDSPSENSSLVAITDVGFGNNTNITVLGNDLTDGMRGVSATGGVGDELEVHFNRIASNATAGARNSTTGTMDAENNWWGCNGGPGAAGCDVVSNTGGGTLDFDPWLVLGVSANPASIPLGGTSAVTASLARNSDGVTPGFNTFPSAIPIAFGATLGTIQSPVPTASDATATSTYTGTTAGTATVSATLDNQTANTNVVVTGPSGGVAGVVDNSALRDECIRKAKRKYRKGPATDKRKDKRDERIKRCRERFP